MVVSLLASQLTRNTLELTMVNFSFSVRPCSLLIRYPID